MYFEAKIKSIVLIVLIRNMRKIDQNDPQFNDFKKCSSGSRIRSSIFSRSAMSFPVLSNIVLTFTNSNHTMFFQFMMDCSVLPKVILLS